MKSVIKNIFLISGICVCCIGIAFLQTFSGRKARENICREMEITITDTLGFIDEEYVKTVVNDSLPPQIGKKYDEVQLKEIEALLERQNDIRLCEAWTTTDGVLHLTISEKEPICLFVDGEKRLYVDATGYMFPVHNEPVMDVPIIEGNASDNVARLESIMNVVRKMPGEIYRIKIDSKGNIIFFRNGGNEVFVFGAPDDPEGKFAKYKIYLEKIEPSRADAPYTSVDLRYKGQIICK